MSSNFSVSNVIEKSKSLDKDIRHMALYDLNTELQKETLKLDENAQKQLAEVVLLLLEDKNSDVQGMAVRCLGPLVKKMSKIQVETSVNNLVDSILKGEDEKRDICTLAVKTVITKIPAEFALDCIQKILPKLIGGLTYNVTEKEKKEKFPVDEIKKHVLEVFIDILTRFGSIIQKKHKELQTAFIEELNSDKHFLRKRAIKCLASLSVHSSVELFDFLIKEIIKGIKFSKVGDESLRTYIQTISAISKTAGYRLGKYLDKIIPLLLKAANDISPEDEEEKREEEIEEEDKEEKEEREEKENEEIEGVKDEVREFIMQAFESFIIRCPEEITENIEFMMIICKEYLQYDPNYDSAEEEEDVKPSKNSNKMEIDEEEKEKDEDGEDEVSDEDDITWKVRLAAVKCISALIQTRSDLLSMVYNDFCSKEEPILIDRFKERSEQVKLEIFNTFVTLLKHTVNFTTTATGEQIANPLKEVKFIKEIKAIAIKMLEKQLKSRSVKTKIGVFQVLRTLISVLQGDLDDHIEQLMIPIKDNLSLKGENYTSLKLEVLQFLRYLIKFHKPEKLLPHFEQILKPLYECVNDKYYKTISESVKVCGELVPVLEKKDSKEITNQMYKNLLEKLSIQDIDQEVKESAIESMGILIARLSSVLKNNLKEVLPIFLDRLKNEITRTRTCKSLGLIAEAKCDISFIMDDSIKELSLYLRKNNPSLRQASLITLKIIVDSFGTKIETSQYDLMLSEVSELINDIDLHLAHYALQLVCSILKVKDNSKKVKDVILPKIMNLLSSSSLQGLTLQSLNSVLELLIKYSSFNNLFTQIIGCAKGENIQKQVYINIGKSICSLCTVSGEKDKKLTIEKFIKDLASNDNQLIMIALYSLAEIGRANDLSKMNVVDSIESFFDSGTEEVKGAASYALGIISIGNLDGFVPHIINEIKSNSKRNYLLIHSLKEIMTKAPINDLKKFVKSSVDVLFAYCTHTEEGIRSVVSECLGKLCLVDYDLVMSKLKDSLKSNNEFEISCVISAVKFTITDQPRDIDSKLKADIMNFLSLLDKKQTLVVRKAAVLLLNSIAHNKKQLIVDLIDKLFPNLYAECIYDKSLVKIIKLGPFNHKIDQGLDLRKSSFEALDTILDGFKKRIDGSKFVANIPSGLHDPNSDIKMLTHLIIMKLVSIFPVELLNVIEDTVPHFAKTLNKKMKENVVQQEKERHDELIRSSLKAIDALNKIPGIEDKIKFQELINEVILKNQNLKGIFRAVSGLEEVEKVEKIEKEKEKK